MTRKLLLCACLLVVGTLFGKDHSSAPRVPSPTIEEAIALIRKHHAEKPEGLKGIFVDEAVYIREADKAYWKIGVRNAEYETGHLIYKVSSDGSVEIDSVVKDG